MAKSREKTQQIGFWDTEVATTRHDAVCLWAYESADAIFRVVCPELFDRNWLDSEIRNPLSVTGRQFVQQGKTFAGANKRPNPRIYKKTLEHVLTSHTGYQGKLARVVGYADLVIETSIPNITAAFLSCGRSARDDEFSGYEISWGSGRPAPSILVEAKDKLPTLGELMRQLNLYRTAFQGKVVVVSPDDTYAKILSEQDVTFIRCPLDA